MAKKRKQKTKKEAKGKKTENTNYREGYIQGLEDAARAMSGTVKTIRTMQNSILLGDDN